MSVASPRVSIVIPTYNHAAFLKTALSSIIGQTFSDWEVIIVNNFSNDETVSVVESFNDKRIQLVNFANHGVIGASRNRGIEMARGEFVAFLDSDDSWYADKLEKCLEAFSLNKADVVSHYLIKNTNGVVGGIIENGPENRLTYKSLLVRGNCLTNSSVMVKRNCLESVGRLSEDREFITAEDYELWLKLAKIGCKFSIVKKVLGEYFIHANNSSGNIERHLQANINVSLKHIENIKGISSLRKFFWARFKLAIIYYGAARQASKQGKIKMAFHFYAKSFILNPFWGKTYIGIALVPLTFIGLKK